MYRLFVLGVALLAVWGSTLDVSAGFRETLLEQQREQQVRIDDVSTQHQQRQYGLHRNASQSPMVKRIWAIIIFVCIVWILVWLIRHLYLEWRDLQVREGQKGDDPTVSDEGDMSVDRLIREGKASLKHDPMYATSKFQAALDHPLTDPQKREIHHYLGIAYVERFRTDNLIQEGEELVFDPTSYLNPDLLKEAQTHLLQAQDLGMGDDEFLLDNHSWLMSVYGFMGQYRDALDVSYTALNLAHNAGEEEKQRYILHRIHDLKKKLAQDKTQKSVYPKELFVDQVEVLENDDK